MSGRLLVVENLVVKVIPLFLKILAGSLLLTLVKWAYREPGGSFGAWRPKRCSLVYAEAWGGWSVPVLTYNMAYRP